MRNFRFICIALLCLYQPSLAHAGQRLANAAIASAHPLASQAGQEIIQRGGNAFDAAVAVSAALAVVEPYSSGFGGGGFWLLHRAADGLESMIDGRETAPGKASRDMYLDRAGNPVPRASLDGAQAAAIPGMPAGLALLARKYGRLPLHVSLAPAIRYAQQGFVVDERYLRMAQSRRQLLRTSPLAATRLLDHGETPQPGYRVRQPELARTLEIFARRGDAGFYRGAVARQMVAAVNASGGIWRLQDLQKYRARERQPVRFSYRGASITTAAPPSAGGVVLAESLNILERLPLAVSVPVARMHFVIEALRRAYHDRARYLGDPDFVALPLSRLLDKDYAAARAANIAPHDATPSGSLNDARPFSGDGDNTTHFSIIDRDGNRVAATLSINTLFGSGFVAGKTGVLLNNEMDDFSISPDTPNVYGLRGSAANAIAPGKRPLSSMTPTFVEDARGVLVLGTPGGSRIISMVLLGILGYVEPGRPDVQQLVAAPRYHHQYLPDVVEVEPNAFAPQLLQELGLLGHVVRETEQGWGDMQAVWLDKATLRASAASDPRGIGKSLMW